MLRETDEKDQKAERNEVTRTRMRMDIHDLKAPISNIIHTVGFLQDEALSQSEISENLDIILRNAKAMQKMVLSLFDDPPQKEAPFILRRERVDIQKLMESAKDQLTWTVHEKNLNIDVKIARDFPQANVDPALLVRVFLNLLDNAIRLSPANGEIRLTAEHHTDHFMIEVLDQGKGLPMAERAKLFDQAGLNGSDPDSDTTHGWGLLFCQQVVKAHGGTIEAVDREGWGGAFSLVLPNDS